MGLFGNKKPSDNVLDDLPAATVALVENPDDVAWRRLEQPSRITFAPKPDELVAAVERSFAPKPVAPEDELVPVAWTRTAPARAGAYWVVERAPRFADQRWEPRLVVVLVYGGSLCARLRRGDSSVFVSVGTLEWMWAGPVALPAGAELEDLRLLG